MSFSEKITWLAEATTDKAAVGSALASLRAEGATSVYDALFTAITLSERGLRPLVVLFTDGEDNASWLGEREIRGMVERSNALVHVVGWRPRPDFRAGPIMLSTSGYEKVLREMDVFEEQFYRRQTMNLVHKESIQESDDDRRFEDEWTIDNV